MVLLVSIATPVVVDEIQGTLSEWYGTPGDLDAWTDFGFSDAARFRTFSLVIGTYGMAGRLSLTIFRQPLSDYGPTIIERVAFAHVDDQQGVFSWVNFTLDPPILNYGGEMFGFQLGPLEIEDSASDGWVLYESNEWYSPVYRLFAQLPASLNPCKTSNGACGVNETCLQDGLCTRRCECRLGYTRIHGQCVGMLI